MAYYQTSVLSERELLSYQADLRSQIFRQIYRVFRNLKENGFTQRKLAKRLRMHTSQLSRILRGDNDLRLETLSDLARALECRIEVRIISLEADALHEEEPGIAFKLSTQIETAASIKDNREIGAGMVLPNPDTWAKTGAMVNA